MFNWKLAEEKNNVEKRSWLKNAGAVCRATITQNEVLYQIYFFFLKKGKIIAHTFCYLNCILLHKQKKRHCSYSSDRKIWNGQTRCNTQKKFWNEHKLQKTSVWKL